MGRRHEAPLSSVSGRAPLGRLLLQLLLLLLWRPVNRRVLWDTASSSRIESAWVVGQDGWWWILLMRYSKIPLWPHTRPKKQNKKKTREDGFVN